jgi:hypothetical protein
LILTFGVPAMVVDLALIGIAIVQSSNRGGSWRVKSWDSDGEYKAPYVSKKYNYFNMILPVIDAQSAPTPCLASKSKRLPRHAKLSRLAFAM